MTHTVHIVGAGLAGLATAVCLAGTGRRTAVYEAAPRAGGRCRSFRDSVLDRVIDSGSHMILSGNRALLGYAERIGGSTGLRTVAPAAFPFLDLRDGRNWTLKPGGLWLLDPKRRVPDAGLFDHLAALGTLVAGPEATAGSVLKPGTVLYDRLWETLIVSTLNGRPDRVSARLFGAVLRETLLKGEAACRPVMAAEGLSSVFVEPALRFLERHGGTVRLGARIDAIDYDERQVRALSANGERIGLESGDAVVLALPPWRTTPLLPWLEAPPAGPAIVNAHFRLGGAAGRLDGVPFLGLIGGTAEWLFQRDDVLSVTVSAADALAVMESADIARLLWTDAARALGTAASMPPVRVVKEKRATFDQTPANAARRPGPKTRLSNLFLAGDWTNTGLPATLEGAVRSGNAAAEAVLRAMR